MVAATVNYVAPWSRRNSLYIAPADQLTTTQYDPEIVQVANGRGRADLTLDVAGFQLLSHASAVTDFTDPAQLDGAYVAESLALVRRMTGAGEVVFLNWMARDSSPRRSHSLPPAPDVHVDLHSAVIARRYARAHAKSALPDPAAYRRALYTSLWRTFSPAPQDWPLALCDYRSVSDDEGVPNFLFRVSALPDVSPDRDDLPGGLLPDEVDERLLDAAGAESAASVFAWRPGHRWFYFPSMQPDEAVLIKLHDTDRSVAWRAPHTSFGDPEAIGAHPRRSVELRSVAYFY
jgi:hypothetical protein